MNTFLSISGLVTSIEKASSYCTLMIGVQNVDKELTYFTIDLNTYFIENFTLKKGDRITAFYDANVPVPLIYPPQYRAVVIHKNHHRFSVKVDYFNERLISSDNQLMLNISPRTKILLPNNQAYLGTLGNQNLVVIYTTSTKSIPAQTTPYEIIVLCS